MAKIKTKGMFNNALQLVGCVFRRTIYCFGAFHAPYVTLSSPH